jgi:hypothetical protein
MPEQRKRGEMTMKTNRREFLYALGGGTGAIAGWVLIPRCARPPFSKDHTNIDFCPRLAKDIALRRIQGGGELMRRDEQGVQRVVCRVNEFSLKVIEDLNGRESIRALAGKLHKGFNPAYLEHTEASVASFLAMLAQAGLLSDPFFVNLYAEEITA